MHTRTGTPDGAAPDLQQYILIPKAALRRFFLGVVLLAALALVTHPLWLTLMARALLLDQPPRQADVILVLGGGAGEREQWGADLYLQGYGQRVITSGESPKLPGEERSFAHISATVLKEMGVPASAITEMPDTTSTYEEALYSLALLAEWDTRTLIVVTDPYHMRRTARTFRTVYRQQRPQEGSMELIFSATPYSWFSVERWWTRERDLLAVVQEYQKGLYYLLKGRLF